MSTRRFISFIRTCQARGAFLLAWRYKQFLRTLNSKIYSNKDLIGTAELQVSDASMGVLRGTFKPIEKYFEIVQKEVWYFWNSKKVDYKRWKSLRFNVQLENGFFLSPIGGYTIEDSPEFPDEPKNIDIAGVHHQIITDFLETEPPRSFVEEPWAQLNIEQKLTFENELKMELPSKKSSTRLFKKHEPQHLLNGVNCSAICHDQRSDDVLYEINGTNVQDCFALVHLTWKGESEVEGYPNTKLYQDFDHFKHDRMYPDKADWKD